MSPDPQAEETQQDASDGTPYDRLTVFEALLIFGGVVVFAALLFEMQDFLNPPLLGAAAVILLWPLREHRVVHALLLSGGFLLGLWFLDRISGILIPFVFVYLLAYLLDPIVGTLKARFGISRWISALMVTVLAVGVIVLFMLLLVPSIVGQVKTLATRIIDSAGDIQAWLASSSLLHQLEQTGFIDKGALVERITTTLQDQAAGLTTSIPDTVQNILQSLGSIFSVIMIVAVMPVALFYTLKDYPYIHPRLVELFPTFGGRRDYLVKAGGIVGNYLRGQLIVSLIGAVTLSTAFILLGVPFGLLLGILGGILNMIPNLGAVITNILGIFIALVFGDPWYIDAIKILGTLTVYSLIEQSLLTPNILSHHVGLHPVLILLSLFVFGYFMGIFGLLIAVPATALIMTVYKAYRDNWNLDLLGRDRTSVPVGSRLRQWREERKEEMLRKRHAKEQPSEQPSDE